MGFHQAFSLAFLVALPTATATARSKGREATSPKPILKRNENKGVSFVLTPFSGLLVKMGDENRVNYPYWSKWVMVTI